MRAVKKLLKVFAIQNWIQKISGGGIGLSKLCKMKIIISLSNSVNKPSKQLTTQANHKLTYQAVQSTSKNIRFFMIGLTVWAAIEFPKLITFGFYNFSIVTEKCDEVWLLRLQSIIRILS